MQRALLALLAVLASCSGTHGLSAQGSLRRELARTAGSVSVGRQLRHHEEIKDATDEELPPLIVVYTMFILPARNWRTIVEGQLKDLNETGLNDHAVVYVIISVPAQDQLVHAESFNQTQLEGLLHEARALVFDYLKPVEGEGRKRCGALVHTIVDNAFEYHGLAALWKMAQMASNEALMLYMHTKGMSNVESEERSHEELVLMEGTVKNWRKYVTVFKKQAIITRAGIWCGEEGQLRKTFFWTRASWAREIEVMRTADRFYYEAWITIAQNAPDEVTNDPQHMGATPGQVRHDGKGCFSMCAYHQKKVGLNMGQKEFAVDCLTSPSSAPH